MRRTDFVLDGETRAGEVVVLRGLNHVGERAIGDHHAQEGGPGVVEVPPSELLNCAPAGAAAASVTNSRAAATSDPRVAIYVDSLT